MLDCLAQSLSLSSFAISVFPAAQLSIGIGEEGVRFRRVGLQLGGYGERSNSVRWVSGERQGAPKQEMRGVVFGTQFDDLV